VAAAVRTARKRGLRVAPRGTGHGAGPLGEAGAALTFVEEPIDPSRIFGEETLTRLRAVKANYDPENVIRSNHPVG